MSAFRLLISEEVHKIVFLSPFAFALTVSRSVSHDCGIVVSGGANEILEFK